MAFRKDLLKVSDEEIVQKKVYIDKTRLKEDGYLEQLSKAQTEIIPAQYMTPMDYWKQQ